MGSGLVRNSLQPPLQVFLMFRSLCLFSRPIVQVFLHSVYQLIKKCENSTPSNTVNTSIFITNCYAIAFNSNTSYLYVTIEYCSRSKEEPKGAGIQSVLIALHKNTCSAPDSGIPGQSGRLKPIRTGVDAWSAPRHVKFSSLNEHRTAQSVPGYPERVPGEVNTSFTP